MASFDYTWNSAFEALPPDQGENASLGASRIRGLKIALRERLIRDHHWAGDAHDGKHKQVTFRSQASDPTLESGDYALFIKNGQLVLLPQGGTATGFGFASGTKMLFQQTTAPTGWTKVTSHNNKALRVVSGSVSSGGSRAFTAAFAATRTTSSSSPGTSSAGAHSHGGSTASHTLTISQIPSHTHTITAYSDTNDHGPYPEGAGTYKSNPSTSSDPIGSTGGGGGHSHGLSSDGNHSHTVNSHNHTLALDVAYVDIIIATKD